MNEVNGFRFFIQHIEIRLLSARATYHQIAKITAIPAICFVRVQIKYITDK